jgi:hypothetical protein
VQREIYASSSFIHSGAGEFRSRSAHGMNRDRPFKLEGAANRGGERTKSAGKCG